MISEHDFFAKVMEFEGFRSKPYRCPSGVLTIGYGHTRLASYYDSVNEFEAIFLLYRDFDEVVVMISHYYKNFRFLPKNWQYALVDLVFNIGISSFKRSSLLKILNLISNPEKPTDNEKLLVSVEILRWNKSKGKVLKGLEKRRQWEVSLLDEE